MADPLTLTLVGTAASGLISAYGAESAGNASANQYNYKAGVAQVNKTIAEQNRDYSFATGGVENQRYGAGAAQRAGNIVTAQSASGFNVNSGSNVDVQRSQRAVTQTDEGQITSNAARRAYGFMTQATGFDAEIGMDRAAASNARTAGDIGAVSSLIGAATSVSSKWYQGTQSGLYGSNGGDPWKGLREGDDGSSTTSYRMS